METGSGGWSVFGLSGDVLVVAFHQHVCALDASDGAPRWRFDPDATGRPAFLVDSGRAYLMAGKRAKVHRKAAKPATPDASD
jgi:glucose dehydrogenase